MTRHSLRQQPPPGHGGTEGPPRQAKQGRQARSKRCKRPPTRRMPPPSPNPHHKMAESGTGYRLRVRCKPPGGLTEEGR